MTEPLTIPTAIELTQKNPKKLRPWTTQFPT